jgi:hypothetical protein
VSLFFLLCYQVFSVFLSAKERGEFAPICSPSDKGSTCTLPSFGHKNNLLASEFTQSNSTNTRISDVNGKCNKILSGGPNATIQMAGDLRIVHAMTTWYLESSPKLISSLESMILVFANCLHAKIKD